MKNFATIAAMLLVLTLVLTACGGAEPDAAGAEPQQVIQVQPDPDPCTELGTPLADVRVRQALYHAIDMDTVVEALLWDSAEKAVSFGPAEADGTALEYDPEKARELLAEAGWPTEYVLDVVYAENDGLTADILAVIGSYWDAVGVQARFRKLEGDVASQLWTAPEDPAEDDSSVEWDLAFVGLMPGEESEYYRGFASDARNNSHTPPQEGLDDAIETADYGKVRQILAENVLVIPLYHPDSFLYVSDHISGWKQGVRNISGWTTDREDETLYVTGSADCYDALTENDAYYALVFETLLNEGGEQLAESHTVSSDGRSVEFFLREELTWQDGEPLTAEDVKFTFQLYLRCPDADTEILEKIEGAAAFIAGEAEECTGISVDGSRIVFTFTEAAEEALELFSRWPILPEHCLESTEAENLRQHSFWQFPVGSGPYRVAEAVPGDHAILEWWEEYRTAGTGNIRCVYLEDSDETDPVLLANLDRLDYTWGYSSDDAASIRKMEGMTVTAEKLPSIRYLLINQFPHESYHGKTE